ncbi:hypothetical protein L1887_47743 [Cichorium endivia]|nr:hypothetical protein L1887_47743 [Cichorium endivia]
MALSNPCDDPWPYRSNRRTTLYASADGVGGQGRDYRRNRRQKTPGVLHGSLPTRPKKAGVARRTLQAETRVAPKCGESVDRVDRHPLDLRRCDMRADLQLAKRKRHGVQLRVSSQKRVLELASTSKSGAAVLSDRAREEKEAKQRNENCCCTHMGSSTLRSGSGIARISICQHQLSIDMLARQGDVLRATLGLQARQQCEEMDLAAERTLRAFAFVHVVGWPPIGRSRTAIVIVPSHRTTEERHDQISMCSTIARSGTGGDEIAEMSEASSVHYQDLCGSSKALMLGSRKAKSGLVAPHRATHDRRDVCWGGGPVLLRLFAEDSLAKGAMSSETCNVAWKREASSATVDEAGQASTMTGNLERDAWAASTGHGARTLGSTGESTLGPQRASMIQSIGRQTSCLMVRASAWRRKEPHPARCSLLTPDCLLHHHCCTSLHPRKLKMW